MFSGSVFPAHVADYSSMFRMRPREEVGDRLDTDVPLATDAGSIICSLSGNSANIHGTHSAGRGAVHGIISGASVQKWRKRITRCQNRGLPP